MITEIVSHNSQINYGKVWCETCGKTIHKEDADNSGMEELGQLAINMLNGMASRHERLHPKHNITVTIYERVPTLKEIREGV